LQPDFAEAFNILGNLHRAKGDLQEAVTNTARAMELDPENIDYQLNNGLSLVQAERYDDAEARYRSILDNTPNHFHALVNLGALFQQQEKWRKALEYYQTAFSLADDDPQLLTNLGVVYLHLNDIENAVRFCRKAIKLRPDFMPGYLNLALALEEKGELDESVSIYEKVLEYYPNYTGAYDYLLEHYQHTNNFDKAVDIAYRILENPDHLKGLYSVASTIFAQVHDWGSFRRAIIEGGINYETREPRGNLSDALLNLNYADFLSSDEVYRRHRAFAGYMQEKVGPKKLVPFNRMSRKDSLLRIGYLSPDFRKHSVGFFIWHVIENHAKEKFSITCYSNSAENDEITDAIKKLSNQFIKTEQFSDEELAEIIRQDEIDILVDLAGHTYGSRVSVLAYKPAPIQATYLGYPNTTGLDQVDFRISDPYSDIKGGTKYSEKLLILPESFLSFGKFNYKKLNPEIPAKRKGIVTYGSFNNLMKITPGVLNVWCRILARVPDSRLLLKSKGVTHHLTQKNIFKEVDSYGIEVGRIILVDTVPNRDDHMDLYNEIDIALDPFPYNGTTTTCEALWMGVPVVTLVGKVHAQRVGYSILKNTGLEELVAHNEDDYVDLAAGLAEDFRRLTELRREIPEKLQASILCNPEKFTRQLEDAYRKIWEAYVDEQTGSVS